MTALLHPVWYRPIFRHRQNKPGTGRLSTLRAFTSLRFESCRSRFGGYNPNQEPGMPEEDARHALDMMNYGMYVVGSRGPAGLNVMAAHWLMQISFKPRMVALSIENDARTLANIRETRVFTVNVMGEESRELVASFLQPANPNKILGRQQRRTDGRRQAQRRGLQDARHRAAPSFATRSPGSSARWTAAFRQATTRSSSPASLTAARSTSASRSATTTSAGPTLGSRCDSERGVSSPPGLRRARVFVLLLPLDGKQRNRLLEPP